MMDNQEKQVLQDRGKEIYDSIIIPPELEDIVKKSIESVDKESIDLNYRKSNSTVSVVLKYFGAAAAVIFLSIFIGLNSSETFAREMGEVPVLGSVARVFTVRKYTVEKKELTIEEEVPKTEAVMENQVQDEIPVTVSENNVQEETEVVSASTVSGNDVSGNNSIPETKMTISGNDIVAVTGDERKIIDTLTPPSAPVTVSGNDMYEYALTVNDFSVDINEKIENYVQKYVSDEKQRFEEYKKAFFDAGGTEKEWADREFDIDVSYEVKYQRGSIVSFVITSTQNWCDVYGERNFYNLDLLNGKNVVLSDLLGFNYADVANVQIVRQMKQRVKDNPEYVYWGVTDEGGTQGFGGFTSVNEDTGFYINAGGNVVIVFDNYEVAPGFMGEQEFEIVVEKDMTID